MLNALRNGLRVITITAVAAYVAVHLIDKQEENEITDDGFQRQEFDDIC